MAKYIQNENYKKKGVKQRKSNSNYNENNRTVDVQLENKETEEVRASASAHASGEANSGGQKGAAGAGAAAGTVTVAANVSGNGKRGDGNVPARNRGYVKTKMKNNFTIRSYRKRQDHTPVSNNPRRKRNDTLTNADNYNNKLDSEGSKSSVWNFSPSDHYLEAGTYEGQDMLMKSQNQGELKELSEDEDSFSIMSDYSDFCQREQYNVECYNYYLNFGDPYVMNNGEISASNNWYYDRQPDYSRVFYYGNQMNDTYEGAVRYNLPNQPQPQPPPPQPQPQPPSYPFCVPGDIYLNNYMANSYINGYMEPTIMANNYYHCPIPQELDQERYFKPMLYTELDDMCTVNPLECDTMNVINLNSSLFVYNSNVHINAVHNEIYGTSSVTDEDAEVADDAMDVSPIVVDNESPVVNESENCN